VDLEVYVDLILRQKPSAVHTSLASDAGRVSKEHDAFGHKHNTQNIAAVRRCVNVSEFF